MFVAQVLIVVSALPISADVSSMWMRRGMPLLGAADCLIIFFTIAKALGDRVAFAAHDCAARKFSDGGLGEVGLPEEDGPRKTWKSGRLAGDARIQEKALFVCALARHARESTLRSSPQRCRQCSQARLLPVHE
ncbi:MAG: hypothetical protein LC097_13650 [Burkholderiales bacterium]|nr:hypothetical protein [Burkholderiales bacterium]